MDRNKNKEMNRERQTERRTNTRTARRYTEMHTERWADTQKDSKRHAHGDTGKDGASKQDKQIRKCVPWHAQTNQKLKDGETTRLRTNINSNYIFM